MSFVILYVGVYLLYTTVSHFSHPPRDPEVIFHLSQDFGLELNEGVSGVTLLMNTFGLAALLAGTTLLARLRRLAAGWWWTLAGFGGFLLGGETYRLAVASESREQIGEVFKSVAIDPTSGLLVLAAVVGLTAQLIARSGKRRYDERRQWVLRRGMRPLLLCATLGVILIVWSQVEPGRFSSGPALTAEQRQALALKPEALHFLATERFGPAQLQAVLPPGLDAEALQSRVDKIEKLAETDRPIWPVVLATAGFLYLWWLSALLFDLSFVWHRYIRHSVSNKRLNQWRRIGHLPSETTPQ